MEPPGVAGEARRGNPPGDTKTTNFCRIFEKMWHILPLDIHILINYSIKV
jgi:hypothetical protein